MECRIWVVRTCKWLYTYCRTITWPFYCWPIWTLNWHGIKKLENFQFLHQNKKNKKKKERERIFFLKVLNSGEWSLKMEKIPCEVCREGPTIFGHSLQWFHFHWKSFGQVGRIQAIAYGYLLLATLQAHQVASKPHLPVFTIKKVSSLTNQTVFWNG